VFDVARLRRLSIDDYAAIISLWQQAGLESVRPYGRDSREAFAAQLAAGQVVLGLEEADQLIGVIVITRDSRKGWINRLAIHRDHRRKGYATRLLAAAEDELRNAGIHVFAALIEADNDMSLRFFARQEYKTHDVVYMAKRDSEDA
jgi:GNAT superfamily N-acetyltransferase